MATEMGFFYSNSICNDKTLGENYFFCDFFNGIPCLDQYNITFYWYKEYYDYSVDIWSLGILLYEMNYGHSPFASNNMRKIISRILTLALIMLLSSLTANAQVEEFEKYSDMK